MDRTSPRSSSEYNRQIENALNDAFLRKTLDKFAVEYRASRDAVFEEIEAKDLIAGIASVKDGVASDLEALYQRFRNEAEKRGVAVHRAKDAEEACLIIKKIAEENGVKNVVKSKSMTAEEIGLNAVLEKAGMNVCETDLGEWIIQLRGEGPSHMVMPAIHLSRGQVADEFEKATGEKQDREDVQKLVKVARRELRPRFHEADMGVSGANFCIAETGSIAIVTNEGNGRLVNTLPKVHVALAGLDKLVPKIEDVLNALQVLPRNATSQRLTAYATFIDGAGPFAKSPTGRKIMHIVLLDNGRSKIAADPIFSQVFRCVRCGACANVCPVFRMVGGHRMGHVYIGAIGLILTYLYHDRNIAKLLCQNCVGCGSCKDICSGGIDLPALIQEIRSRFSKEDRSPIPAKLASVAMKNRNVFHALLKFMRFSQKPFSGKDGFIRHLPMAIFGKQGFKSLPAFAPESFREMWPKVKTRKAGKPRMKIALFAGCAQDFVFPSHLMAAMEVFSAANVEVVFPEKQTCCGLPLLMMGESETARDVARQNIAAFAEDCDAIVTLCASCASHLKHGYRNLLKEDAAAFAEKVTDFSSFIYNVAGLDSLKVDRRKEQVAYHASCHLCRGLNVKDEPREILKAAADYVPSREEESCCGFGGTFSAKFPGISAELMRKKLSDIKATGAKRLALDCPGCSMQISGGADAQHMDLKVSHVAEILAEAIANDGGR